jgi:N-acyl homoserine lactone hydrolase
VTDVRRLYVLLCGYEILRKTISTRDRGRRFVLAEPVCAYLLDTAEGFVLLDAGYDPAPDAGPQDVHAFFNRTGCYPPVVGEDHRIETQLTAIGVRLEEIGCVVLSHMHFDHTGLLKSLPHADVFVQKDELAHAMTPGASGAYARADYNNLPIRWREVEGDWRMMDGLDFYATPGHTPGHQSALITLQSDAKYLLPFDAGDLQENFEAEIAPGETSDEQAALASIRRLKALGAEQDAHFLLFHDPVAIQQMRLAPAYYD